MRRSILRHFVGNREQLEAETAEMIAAEAATELEQILSTIPVWADSGRVAEAVVANSQPEEPWAVFDILINESGTMPQVARLVSRRLEQMTAVLADWLRGWSGQSGESTAVVLIALRRQVVCRWRLGERSNHAELRAASKWLSELKPSAAEMPGDRRFELEEGQETEIGVND